MRKRFVSIWFRHLETDWFTIRRPELQGYPFVLATPDHGRMVITSANALAQELGIYKSAVVADARAIIPSLQVLDHPPDLAQKLLKRIGEWCIRYSPIVSIDLPDGLILDATGCAHLWGGEELYLEDIVMRLKALGYTIRIAIADTIGTAWGIARYGRENNIIKSNDQTAAILSLPPQALRIEPEVEERLLKLGLRRISDFISMARSALRRRFGPQILKRLDQAIGKESEEIEPVLPIEPYQERLPCLEPIATNTGIEIALKRLLDTICQRLKDEGKGLRIAIFKCFRIDGRIESLDIETNRASSNAVHLFKLFELKICTVEPALGIDLFMIEAKKVEKVSPVQQKLWERSRGLENSALSELLDRLSGKIGTQNIKRYLPDEHYWPERSFRSASSLNEKTNTQWKLDRPRPLQLLPIPEVIEVTAPIPDYPPMLFRYKGNLHKIIKADGPERIEQEWWLQQGQHRDYYYVEDESGRRYWVFRLGHYDEKKSYKWFMHGFFV